MKEAFIPSIPPVLLFTFIYLAPPTTSSALPRYAALTAVTATAVWSILHPAYDNALFNYLAGFFASWYIIWTANVFLVHDPAIRRRLQRSTNMAGGEDYVWQSLPPICSPFRRACWSLDLTVNFRGLGWDHLSPCSIPPEIKSQLRLAPPAASRKGEPIRETQCSWTRLSLKEQALRMSRAYVLLLISHVLLLRGWTTSQRDDRFIQWVVIQTREVIGTSFGIYGFVDGIHAGVTILATQLLGPHWLGTAGMPSMYPPLFGQSSNLGRFRIQDLWGKFWHDLFKTGFLSMAQWLIPNNNNKNSAMAARTYRLLLCFGLSAFVHGAATYSSSLDFHCTASVMLFFCIQPAGVVQQHLLVKSIKKRLATQESDKADWVILLGEVFTGLLWIYLTLPLVTRDVGMREALRETTSAIIPQLW